MAQDSVSAEHVTTHADAGDRLASNGTGNVVSRWRLNAPPINRVASRRGKTSVLESPANAKRLRSKRRAFVHVLANRSPNDLRHGSAGQLRQLCELMLLLPVDKELEADLAGFCFPGCHSVIVRLTGRSPGSIGILPSTYIDSSAGQKRNGKLSSGGDPLNGRRDNSRLYSGSGVARS